MTTITTVLTADHRHGDRLFDAALQAAGEADWPACRERLGEFVQALRHHMRIEEEILFPAFERASGVSGGPTWVMRQEHQQMLAMLDRIASAAAARDADGFDALARSFAALMAAHSAKEERVLYPMCDEMLPGFDPGSLLRQDVPQPAAASHPPRPEWIP